MLPFLLSILFSLYFYVDSLAAVFANGTNSTYDVFDYVDPLIGTANGGEYCFESKVGMNEIVTWYRECLWWSYFTIWWVLNTFEGNDRGADGGVGMAKAVADVNGDNQGGFATDGSNVTGFSTMHDSGTGGVSLNHTPIA